MRPVTRCQWHSDWRQNFENMCSTCLCMLILRSLDVLQAKLSKSLNKKCSKVIRYELFYNDTLPQGMGNWFILQNTLFPPSLSLSVFVCVWVCLFSISLPFEWMDKYINTYIYKYFWSYSVQTVCRFSFQMIDWYLSRFSYGNIMDMMLAKFCQWPFFFICCIFLFPFFFHSELWNLFFSHLIHLQILQCFLRESNSTSFIPYSHTSTWLLTITMYSYGSSCLWSNLW